MITLYGIPNCDTVKKARAWLTEHGVDHHFHDFKKQGVSDVTLDRWIAALGWEQLLNRKGTTWRGLDEATRATVTGVTAAKDLMRAHTSLIKRPVVEWTTHDISVGFSADEWGRRRPKR